MRLVSLKQIVLTVTMAALPAFGANFDIVGLNDSNNTAQVSFNYEQRGAPGSYYYGIALTITNTSAQYLPRVSGFAFNLPTSVTGLDAQRSVLNSWYVNTASNAIRTPEKLGYFDICAETGSGSTSNCNGGIYGDSIERGESGSFFLALTGSSLDSLNTSSFLGLTSAPERGYIPTAFTVRFQSTGALGGGSDMGIMTPEPAQIASLCVGLLVSAFWLRSRRRQAAAARS